MDQDKGTQRLRKEQSSQTESKLKDILRGPINYTHIPSTVSHFVAFAWQNSLFKRLFSIEDIVGGGGKNILENNNHNEKFTNSLRRLTAPRPTTNTT